MYKAVIFIYLGIFLLISLAFNQNVAELGFKYIDAPISEIHLYINTTENSNFYPIVNQKKQEFSLLENCEHLYHFATDELVDTFAIAGEEQTLENIKSVYITNGYREFLFKGITDFQKGTTVFCDKEKGCAPVTVLYIPESVRHYSFLPFNHRSLFFTVKKYIFSLLTAGYSMFACIFLPLLALFLYLLFYHFPKYVEKSACFLNRYFYHILSFIFLLFLAMRYDEITYFSFSYDEYFSIDVAGNYRLSWNYLFKDPGNPPFYFLLVRLWNTVFPVTALYTRSLNVLLSMVTFFLGVYTAKKFFNSKIATLLVGLIIAVHPAFVIPAQVVRGYILFFLWGILLTIFVVRTILQPLSFKRYFLFVILGCLIINTHYYCALMLLASASFVFGTFLLQKRALKDYIVLVVSYGIIGVSFLPFLIIRALDSAWNNAEFNTWLPSFSVLSFGMQLYLAYGSFFYILLFFVLTLFLIFYRKAERFIEISKTEKIVLLYTVFSVFFILLSAVAISFVRNIFDAKYLFITYIFLLINAVSVLCLKWRYKWGYILSVLFLLLTLSATIYSATYRLISTFTVSEVARIVSFLSDEKREKQYYYFSMDTFSQERIITFDWPKELTVLRAIDAYPIDSDNEKGENVRLLSQNVVRWKKEDTPVCVLPRNKYKIDWIILKNQDILNLKKDEK